ncbi:P-loop containing nucleoside triphosphate hydrolase protein [Ramaria rubella]|nr:P-loop containing nucleoside triphosphate hydrolase protein [Ramaria rubella]
MSLSPHQVSSHLPHIRQLICDWESSEIPNGPTGVENFNPLTTSDVIVAFRTRPVLPGEDSRLAAQVDTNTVSMSDEDNTQDSYLCTAVSLKRVGPGLTVVHVPSMKWNGLSLMHKNFESDLAFGPNASNEDVYRMTVDTYNMVSLALAGGVVCILAYGQTGTGKTYSMNYLAMTLAHELFRHATKTGSEIKSQNSYTGRNDGSDPFAISVTFLEIIGKSAYDLAADDAGEDNRTLVNIYEDKLGRVRPELVTTHVTNAAELISVIERCLSYRRTAATSRNATSSRSHALLMIRIKNLLIPNLEDGEFILADLAGSERYEDNKAHSKQLMNESRENNKSLLALKECVRARARAGAEDGFVHIPYRSSRLTWVLKPIFDMEETRITKTLVIAHVSPHIQDVSHSVNTLSYAAPFRILPPRRPPASYDSEDPRTWDHDTTIKWLGGAFRKQQQARREAEWELQRTQAQARKQRLLSFSPLPQNRDCLVDLIKFCPRPHGGTYLARMYGAEWVQMCLQNRNPALLNGYNEEVLVEAIKADSLNVYLSLNQMLVYARTRTRKAVMNSRRATERSSEGTSVS